MAATPIVGSVGVQVDPVFSGTQRAISREYGKAADSVGASAGSRLGSAFGTAMKIAAGTAVAGIGVTLQQGFARLTAMEDAQASLRGLGHEAKDVERIMADVEGALNDTIFKYADGAQIAAGALASGIDEGKELESYLRTVADAATQSGTDFNAMGQIFNRVSGDGRVMNDTIQQLGANGIYVAPMLAKEFGVTQAAVREMAAAGEIDAATFQRVMEENIGGSASRAAETTSGALSLAWSSVGQLGETVLASLMPHIRTAAQGFTEMMYAAQPAGEAIGNWLGGAISNVMDLIGGLDFSSWDAFTDSLGTTAGTAFESIGNSIQTMMPAFRELWELLPSLGNAAGSIASAGLDLLVSALSFIADNIDTIIKWLPVVVAGFIAWRVASRGLATAGMSLQAAQLAMTPVLFANNAMRLTAARLERQQMLATAGNTAAQSANNAVQRRGIAAKAGAVAALVGQKVALVASTVATGAAAAATRLFNAALRANPIGIIITAITALIGALVWFFTQTEVGKQIWQTVWSAITAAAMWAWEMLQPVFEWIGQAAQTIGTWFTWLWQNAIMPAWDGIVAAVTVAWEWISGIFTSIVTAVSGFLAPIFGWFQGYFQFVWAVISEAIRIAWAVIETIFHVIVKVVTDILAPAFTWFYENVILPVWNWISTAIQMAWNNVIYQVFTAISNFVSFLGDMFSWFYNSIIQPVWNWISTAISWAWENVIRPAFTAIGDFVSWLGDTFNWFYNNVISPVWNWISDTISSIWNNNIKPVFQALGDFISDNVAPLFEKGVDAIKDAWDNIKEIAKAPIDFVINTVINDGLLGALNKVRDWVDLDPVADVKIPGFARGGHTGPGGKYEPAGIVHAGEFVFQQTATNKLMRRFGMAGMDYINRTGEIPDGYSGGGLVQPVNGPVTSGFGPRGGGHHSGIDWAVPIGTRVLAALAGTVLRAGFGGVLPGRTGGGVYLGHEGGRQTYYGHLSQMLVDVGDQVAKGQAIALSGNTGNSTGPHLHFETHSGGKALNPARFLNGAMIPEGEDVDGGGGGVVGWLLTPIRNLVDGLADSIRGAFPGDGMFVDTVVGAGQSTLHNVVDWAEEKLRSIGDFFFGSDSGEGHAAGAGGIKGEVQNVATKYGWGTGAQWSALEQLVQRESSWNLNAANPTSSARGLFQKMTSVHGPVASDAAGQAAWGLDYIDDRYGSPLAALAHHNRNNWYADGGYVNPLVRDGGGVLPPGLSMVLNARGEDEWVVNRNHVDQIESNYRAASGSGSDRHYHYYAGQNSPSVSDFVHEVDHRTRRLQGV